VGPADKRGVTRLQPHIHDVRAMSAWPPIAKYHRTWANVTELAIAHSITSSAVASSLGGMGRPSALAVWRLRIDLNLVGLFDRDVGGLRPAQNLIDQLGGAPKQIRKACSV
jgi:hypothetical protein